MNGVYVEKLTYTNSRVKEFHSMTAAVFALMKARCQAGPFLLIQAVTE